METKTSPTAPPSTLKKTPDEGVDQREVNAVQRHSLDPTSGLAFYLPETSSESDSDSDEATVPNTPRVDAVEGRNLDPTSGLAFYLPETSSESDGDSDEATVPNTPRASEDTDEVDPPNTTKKNTNKGVFQKVDAVEGRNLDPTSGLAFYLPEISSESDGDSDETTVPNTPRVSKDIDEGGHVGGSERNIKCSKGKLKRTHDEYEPPPDEVLEHDPGPKRRRTAKR